MSIVNLKIIFVKKQSTHAKKTNKKKKNKKKKKAHTRTPNSRPGATFITIETAVFTLETGYSCT